MAAPVIGIAASAIALGEVPTLSLGIAVVLIVAGIALGTISPAQPGERPGN